MKNLKTDYIDLYYLHRINRDIPIEDVRYALLQTFLYHKFQRYQKKYNLLDMHFLLLQLHIFNLALDHIHGKPPCIPYQFVILINDQFLFFA